jgi:hypothetical protein
MERNCKKKKNKYIEILNNKNINKERKEGYCALMVIVLLIKR